MVLCLLTLTDLYVRRAGLSASAELLVLNRSDGNDAKRNMFSAVDSKLVAEKSAGCLGLWLGKKEVLV